MSLQCCCNVIPFALSDCQAIKWKILHKLLYRFIIIDFDNLPPYNPPELRIANHWLRGMVFKRKISIGEKFDT